MPEVSLLNTWDLFNSVCALIVWYINLKIDNDSGQNKTFLKND